jgi:hypothetical protein
MTRIATHYDAINALSLRALQSCAGRRTTASTVIADIYEDYRTGYYNEYKRDPSPFMRPKGGINLSAIFHKNAITQAWSTCTFSHRAKGRAMELTVFPDLSCILTFKETNRKNGKKALVPWSFCLPGVHEHEETEFDIIAFSHGPRLHHPADEEEPVPIFNPKEPATETSQTRSLRHSYQTLLRHEMTAIIDALSDLLPISTGKDWLQQGLDGTAAVPADFTYSPTPSRGPDAAKISPYLSPYLDAKFPDMKKLRGEVWGRAMAPDGTIGDIEVELRVDDEREHTLEWILADFLNRDDCPVPMSKQISRSASGRPQPIFLGHVHKPGQSTAHQQIEALTLMDPRRQMAS